MKKDLDFLKNKINASLNAPESVDESFVLSRLQGEENTDKNIISIKSEKKPKNKALPTVAAAVAIVLIGALGFGVIPKMQKSDIIKKAEAAQSEVLSAYTSYSEIRKDIKKLDNRDFLERIGVPYFSSKTDSIAADGYIEQELSSVSKNYGETFTQVEGIDEDDIIKTNGKYIFYAGNKYNKYSDYYDDNVYIFIYSAQGKSSKLINEIKIEPLKNDYCEINGMYLVSDKLIAEISNYETTQIKVYDISDINNIKTLGSVSQSGTLSSSRVIGENLILVTNEYSYDDIPFVCCGDEKQTIPAENIYRTENPSSANFLIVSKIDLSNLSKTEDTKAVLCGNSQIYCNEEHMFVVADITDFTDLTYAVQDIRHSSQLFKIDISDGIKFTSEAKISGYVESQYSMDEFNGVFRIAVTDLEKNGADINRLYTFDENLKELGKISGFAKGEHIEAVKFIENTAYVITYETTDPLFVIDLTDAKAPEILGEVKLDGFSNTLIPIGGDKLLGVGTDSDFSNEKAVCDGFKVVLFDISDKLNPKVLDEKVYKNTETDAKFNPKCILKNEGRQSFTVYATFYRDLIKKYDPDFEYYYDSTPYQGSLTFSVKGEKIVTENEYISKKLESPVGRCTFIDDTVYIIDDCQNIDCTRYN